MLELPDVEVFMRYMEATSLHQKIRFVGVRNEKILGDFSARTLQGTLKGHTFESTRRHGKNLFAGLDGGGWMLMHFGMTGRLAYFKDLDEEPFTAVCSSPSRTTTTSPSSVRGCSARWSSSKARRSSCGRKNWALTLWIWTAIPSGNASRAQEEG